ncbi:MAG: glycosyltransferase family 4 protein [Verrucomicrobiota bacterium]
MKILFITPGTGAYYCGVCLRDRALVQALQKLDYKVLMLPTYLPLVTEDDGEKGEASREIFYGGINVYLQEKLPFFRALPQWMDKWLSSYDLLKWVSRFQSMTSASEHGKLTLSMLKGEEGNQAKELNRLVGWVQKEFKPDAIVFSTSLLVGMARMLKKRLGCSVGCFLQGEENFLDSLEEPYREDCWQLMGERCSELDWVIAPSKYFAKSMTQKMGFKEELVNIVPNGIETSDYQASTLPWNPPVIGYLARMCEEKGLDILVDAFLLTRKQGIDVHLKIAGAYTEADESFVSSQKRKIEDSGYAKDVSFHPNLTKEEKIDFYKGLTLFSVPATYSEAFGLYVVEAMAAGVPVVLPKVSAFQEIVDSTGGGMVYDYNRASTLNNALQKLLRERNKVIEMAEQGKKNTKRIYDIAHMAEQFIGVIENNK